MCKIIIMETIEINIGKKVGVMAVCDKGFAKKFSEYVDAMSEAPV